MEKRRVDIELITSDKSEYKDWMFYVHDKIVEFEDEVFITTCENGTFLPYIIMKRWTRPISDPLDVRLQKLIKHYQELQLKCSDADLIAPFKCSDVDLLTLLLTDLQNLLG